MSETVKRVTCVTPGEFRNEETVLGELKPSEVVVGIKRIGICGTDLHAFAGNQPFFTYPRVLGHELAGEALEVGSAVAEIRRGDRLLILPYITCGSCVACLQGKTNCCTTMNVLGVHSDGGMQEKIILPASILLSLNDLEYEQIALIEPLAIGAHALCRAEVTEAHTIVVVGCGPIGIGIIAQAKAKGARVIAIDMQESRLDFVLANLEVSDLVRAGSDAVQQVKDLTAGNLADIVFDATGNKKALESGPEYMAHGGKFILVGLFKGELSFHHPALHAKEASVLSSRNATRADFLSVISFLRSGVFAHDQFITHTASFDKLIDDFPQWTDAANGVIKAMVTVG